MTNTTLSVAELAEVTSTTLSVAEPAEVTNTNRSVTEPAEVTNTNRSVTEPAEVTNTIHGWFDKLTNHINNCTHERKISLVLLQLRK